MIEGQRIMALIPARGGSKGVPRKNLRMLAGKPLIAWTIEAAKSSQYIDEVVLSSEDDEIIQTARAWGCATPFVRPAVLAGDEVSAVLPVLHAIQEFPGFDYVVLLQPTSPLRLPADIDACIEQCLQANANACVSVAKPDKSPYWMMQLDERARMVPVLGWNPQYRQRQDLPEVFALNGSIYVAKCDWLSVSETFLTEDTLAYEMPRHRSVDIDTELDLIVAEAILRNRDVESGIRKE